MNERLSRIIRDASVRYKLIAILLVPMLGLAFFAGQTALDAKADRDDAQQVSDLVDLSLATGDLTHSLQNERGLTALFIITGGQRYGEELEAARAETDASMATFLGDAEAYSWAIDADTREQITADAAQLQEI